MHHFTMRKMKTEEPKTLASMIERYINSVEKPQTVTPKPRAPRGFRKRRDGLSFNRVELEKLLTYAKKMGEDELVMKLSPKRSLQTYKKELISSIKNEEVNERLWKDYVEAVAAAELDESSRA